MITIKQSGNFNKTERFLNNAKNMKLYRLLNECGRKGVSFLAAATPVDSGLTAQSWDFTIKKTSEGYRIDWSNSNVVNGVSIAVILQYGHGTGTGGYVPGRNYINPPIQKVFDDLAESLRKEVSSL